MLVWLLIASVGIYQVDTPAVLAELHRDLTGDGAPEILRLVRAAQDRDATDVVFTIESEGKTLYRFPLLPLARTPGDEARARIEDSGRFFFAEEKFQSPQEFIERLRAQAPARVAEIPDVVSRDRQASDTTPGELIWEEIQQAGVTVFGFSPGGDEIVAIGWNARAGRFYRLLECC